MNIRFRHIFMALGLAIVIGALYLTDPDNGVSTVSLLLGAVTPVIAIALAHLARKALFDYGEADMQRLFRNASQSASGSGMALIALALVISALLGLFGRAAHAAEPPARAFEHLPTLKLEVLTHWPQVPVRAYLGGLIEHESCISLTSPRCWSPTSRLKTQREEGAGLGQLTRAYDRDGSLRFDKLAELRAKYPELRALSWATVYQRPDLQLRAVVLLSRENYLALAQIKDSMQRLAMADLAYNAGLGRVDKDRRACQMTAGCDPQRWFNHAERTCTASTRPLYGARSACDIMRHHVRDVFTVRAPKYVGLL